MSMHESIISQEDREFNTSMGNWTGDALWEPGPIPQPYGYAVFHMNPGDTQKESYLEYPFVKINHGTIHRFILQLFTNEPPFDMTITVEITDGVYTFSGFQIITPPPYFTYVDFYADVPTDFKTDQSKIIVRVEKNVTAEEGIMYTTFYTCTYETRIDYLPLMGMA
jgi:hypothetical protein